LESGGANKATQLKRVVQVTTQPYGFDLRRSAEETRGSYGRTHKDHGGIEDQEREKKSVKFSNCTAGSAEERGIISATTYATTPGKRRKGGAQWRVSSEEIIPLLEGGTSTCGPGNTTRKQTVAALDRERIALGFQKGLEGIGTEAGQNAMHRICTHYAELSPNTWIWFQSGRDGKEGHEERVSVMMQGALNRRWGYSDLQKTCWNLGTWKAALTAVQHYVNDRAETPEGKREVAIVSPYASETCAGSDETAITKMMDEMIDNGIANAKTVVVPCLQKTREMRHVGHFFIAVVEVEKRMVTIVDSMYNITAETAESRTRQFLTPILKKMEGMWHISANEWVYAGKGQGSQLDSTTCGPRSMLNAMAELVDGKDKQSLLKWHGKIQAVEDFLLHQMHVCGQVMDQQSDEGELWYKGRLVQEGTKTEYGGGSEGKSQEDVINLEMISESMDQGGVANDTTEGAGGGGLMSSPDPPQEEWSNTAPGVQGHRHGDGGRIK
jgi:hypothetical protein